MKRITLILATALIAFAALIAVACGNDDGAQRAQTTGNTSTGGDSTNGNANASQQQTGMGGMMNDPNMMRQMMDGMMKSPDMMRQMMTDPKMVEMMTRYINEHPGEMDAHMQMMMEDADHRRAMTEMLRRNPAMREQMRSIISEAGRPGDAGDRKAATR